MGIMDRSANRVRKVLDRIAPLTPLAPPAVTAIAPERIVHRTGMDAKYVTIGAQTDAEAARLYMAAKEQDPFPDVPPALLNSAHIEDYTLATAMVFPYQRERRKTASYALRVGRQIAFLDPKHPEQGTYHDLNPFESFLIPPNSLVYFQTKELFQLPNYMAVRFNLHIELVHKGLLLGTGPLVDPGFSGRLLIPLHNMTANTYVLAEDDEVIWVEFTKTSPHPNWVSPARRLRFRGGPRASFAKFPSPKTGLGIADYFRRARRPHESRPDAGSYPFPANAIPGAVEEARFVAKRAEGEAAGAREEANRAAGVARTIRNLGVIAALVAAASVFFPVLSLIGSALSMVQTTTTMAETGTPGMRALADRLADMQRDTAARDLVEVRLLKLEYCALRSDPRVGAPTVAAVLGRLRFAQTRANASSKAAGGRAPFPTLAPSEPPNLCPPG